LRPSSSTVFHAVGLPAPLCETRRAAGLPMAIIVRGASHAMSWLPVYRGVGAIFLLGAKAKPRSRSLERGFGDKSLTMTYFHRRPSTIIGAKAFHCPVRDGKE